MRLARCRVEFASHISLSRNHSLPLVSCFLSQPRSLQLIIPNSQVLFRFNPLILDHPRVLSNILSLHLQSCLWFFGLNDKVVVAVRAVLVAVFEFGHVFAETLFTFLACKGHFHGLFESVVLGFGVAFGAVEPLFAARGADGDLGVEDVFAIIST